MKVLQLLEEKDGKASFSRIASLILVSSVIGWVTYIVFKNHSLPDMGSVGVFLSSTLGTLYSTNKIASAISGNGS